MRLTREVFLQTLREIPKEDCYTYTVWRRLREKGVRTWPILPLNVTTVYFMLDELEAEGVIHTYQVAGDAARGYRAKRMIELL